VQPQHPFNESCLMSHGHPLNESHLCRTGMHHVGHGGRIRGGGEEKLGRLLAAPGLAHHSTGTHP